MNTNQEADQEDKPPRHKGTESKRLNMKGVHILKVANGWMLRESFMDGNGTIERAFQTYVYRTVPELAQGLLELLDRTDERPPAGTEPVHTPHGVIHVPKGTMPE